MGKFRQTMDAPPPQTTPKPPMGKGVLRTNTEPALMGITNGLENQVIRAATQPGAADYPAAELPKPKGGRFNNGNAKSGLEWEMYRSAQIPGPSDYPAATNGTIGTANGGRFSTACPKTDVEWQMYRAARQPGPMEYGPVPSDVYKPSVDCAQLAVSGPQNDLDGIWHIPENAEKPGPGEYPGVDAGAQIGGGRFNRGRAKSDLEWTIFNAKQRPGPGAYDVPTQDVNGKSSTVSLVGGGKWNRAASKSGLEWDIYRASQLPGPDYDTNAVYQYLEGKSGGAKGTARGARILGRAGFNLPAPFNQYYSGTESAALTGPSESHAAATTGFRQGHRPLRSLDEEPEPEAEVEPGSGAAAAEVSGGTTLKRLNERLRQQVKGAVCAGRSVNGTKVHDAASLFRAIDKDGGASISPTELVEGLERLDISVMRIVHTGNGYDNDVDSHKLGADKGQLEALIRTIDVDQNGQIHSEELEEWLNLRALEDGSNPDPRKHGKAMVRKLHAMSEWCELNGGGADWVGIAPNGHLTRQEFVLLQHKCGRGDQAEALTFGKWARMCQAFGAKSERQGIDVVTLMNMYASAPDRLVDDFIAIGAKLTQKEMGPGSTRAKQDNVAHRKRGYATPKHLRPKPPTALRLSNNNLPAVKSTTQSRGSGSVSGRGGARGSASGNGSGRGAPKPPGDRTVEQLPPRLRMVYSVLQSQSSMVSGGGDGGMSSPYGSGAMTERPPGAKALLSADELTMLYGSGNIAGGGGQTERVCRERLSNEQ